MPPAFLAACAGTTALGVELFKLVREPALDRFRETLTGKLLLGRYFTVGAILAYWLAILLVAIADARFQPGRGERLHP